MQIKAIYAKRRAKLWSTKWGLCSWVSLKSAEVPGYLFDPLIDAASRTVQTDKNHGKLIDWLVLLQNAYGADAISHKAAGS